MVYFCEDELSAAGSEENEIRVFIDHVQSYAQRRQWDAEFLAAALAQAEFEVRLGVFLISHEEDAQP